MDVRVCGPNLNDQRRATFHVHEASCRHLEQYGPGRRFGGDWNGEDEMLVKDATLMKVSYAVYDNGILDEAVLNDGDNGRTKDEIADDYISDFYFAPCAKGLTHG